MQNAMVVGGSTLGEINKMIYGKMKTGKKKEKITSKAGQKALKLHLLLYNLKKIRGRGENESQRQGVWGGGDLVILKILTLFFWHFYSSFIFIFLY